MRKWYIRSLSSGVTLEVLLVHISLTLIRFISTQYVTASILESLHIVRGAVA